MKTRIKEEKQKEKVTGKNEFKTTSVSSEGRHKIRKKKVLPRVASNRSKEVSTSNGSMHQINRAMML